EHAVLDRRADADDGGREITGTDLSQRVDVRGIGFDDVGAFAAPVLDERGSVLHGHVPPPQPGQGGGRRGPEASPPDDQDGGVFFSQRPAFPRGSGTVARSPAWTGPPQV